MEKVGGVSEDTGGIEKNMPMTLKGDHPLAF